MTLRAHLQALHDRYEVHAFAIDERARRGESTAGWAGRPPLYWRGFLHATIPAPLLCRRLGHRPLVDGTGEAGERDHRGELRANRWVECGRCGVRPEPQGHLDPARWPRVGARYTGPFLTAEDAELLQAALRSHKEARPFDEDARRQWRETYYRPGPWPGTRRVEVSCEVHVDPLNRWLRDFDLGGKVGVGGSRESTVSVDVHVGPLSLYLRESHLFGERLARRVSYLWSPEVSLRLHRFDGRTTLQWHLWDDPGGDLRDRRGGSRYHPRRRGPYGTDLRLRRGHVEPWGLIAGRPVYGKEVVATTRVTIPLPEGPSEATAELQRATWRTRVSRRTRYYVEVTPDRPFPVPGNLDSDFYDGDDAISSLTVAYEGVIRSERYSPGTEPWAVAATTDTLQRVLSHRLRYGGSASWTPKPAETG